MKTHSILLAACLTLAVLHPGRALVIPDPTILPYIHAGTSNGTDSSHASNFDFTGTAESVSSSEDYMHSAHSSLSTSWDETSLVFSSSSTVSYKVQGYTGHAAAPSFAGFPFTLTESPYRITVEIFSATPIVYTDTIPSLDLQFINYYVEEGFPSPPSQTFTTPGTTSFVMGPGSGGFYFNAYIANDTNTIGPIGTITETASYSLNVTFEPVPEPSTVVLLGGFGVLAGLHAWRKRRARATGA